MTTRLGDGTPPRSSSVARSMPEPCALNLDNIAAVPKGFLTEHITRLGPGKLAELCTALNIAAGC